jgi:hypothetical protein
MASDNLPQRDAVGLDTEKEQVSNIDGNKAAGNQDVHHAMDPAHRAAVEKSLKRKLDARCSLFVLIYIMVRFASRSAGHCNAVPDH